VLEEIRLLGNLENRNGKLLQIVLAGQPEFDRKLDAPNLRQLKQRIVLRYSLQPFTLRDAVEYMQSRLERAGMPNQTVFSEELMAEIHLRTQGIPRVINAICDNLLLTAFALEQKVCTVEMLDEMTGPGGWGVLAAAHQSRIDEILRRTLLARISHLRGAA
jgi:general secretion pathway protein A